MEDQNANTSNQEQEQSRSIIDGLLGNPPTAVNNQAEGQDSADQKEAPAENQEQNANEVNNNQEKIPSTDIYQGLAEISNGLIKSEDDFKSTIEKVGKYSGLESQLEQLTKENEALKNVNPFPNDYIKTLSELYASGAPAEKIETFQRINALGDVNALTSEEALKWQLREKYNLTHEQAEIKLRNTYKLDEFQFTEDEVESAKIDVKIAGDEAKAYLKGLQKSFEVAAPEQEAVDTPEQIAEKQKQFEAKVAPVITNIEQELPSYFTKINVNGKEGDLAQTIDLPLPEAMQKSIAAQTRDFAIVNNIDTSNPEHVSGLKEYAKNLAKIQMFDAWIIDATSKKEVSIREEFNNPGNINRGKDNPTAPSKTGLQSSASRVAETM